jgi:hypothetical protein
MEALLAVTAMIAPASVAMVSSDARAEDAEQIFNIQSITGLVQVDGCCGRTPGEQFASFEKFAIVALMAPGKYSKVTVTGENVPDELTLTGVNLSVAGSSKVFENGAIKFNVTETGR